MFTRLTTTESAARVVSPAPRSVWSELVEADPLGLVGQTPAWTDAICDAAPYQDASRLYEFGDGRRFVLPLVRRVGRPAALAAVRSFPADWGIGGLLGPDLDRGVVDAVLADLADADQLAVSIRPNPLTAEHWPTSDEPGCVIIRKRAHVVDLSGGPEAVQAQFSKSSRRSIRRAERNGVTIECDDTGALIPVLYDLTVRAVERWAAQQSEPLTLARLRHRRRDPLAKLQAIARHLGTGCRLYVARVDGSPVAANMVLFGRNAHATRGAIDPGVGRDSRAGHLLDWVAINDAMAAGCRSYHLGESGQSQRLATYKESFGARPYDYAEVRLERLPLTSADRAVRTAVKRLVGFRDR